MVFVDLTDHHMINNVTKIVIKVSKNVVGRRIRIFLSKMDQKSQKS